MDGMEPEEQDAEQANEEQKKGLAQSSHRARLAAVLLRSPSIVAHLAGGVVSHALRLIAEQARRSPKTPQSVC